MNARRKQVRGFTLLELLVSLVLFALLATALQQGLYSVSAAARASEQTTERAERQRVVGALLERHLSQALPVMHMQHGRPRLLFHGEGKRLVFVSLLPVLADHAGASELVLAAPRQPGDELTLAYRPLSLESAGEFGRGDYHEHALGVELAGLRLAYFGAHEPGQRTAWHERWRDTRRLPQAVRLRLRSRAGDDWPEMIVMLRAARDDLLHRRGGSGDRGHTAVARAGVMPVVDAEPVH